MMFNELRRDFIAVTQFAKRNLLAFFRERTTVFFSLLSPLIVLMLYIFFLGDVQVDSIMSAIPEGIPADEKLIKSFVDSWLIAGIMCVSTMTVALNSMLVMVADKEKKINRDFLSAPVKPYVLTLGYYLSFYAITFIICFAVLLVGMIYLAARGAFYITASDFFVSVGILLLSVMNSTVVLMFIMSFIKSGSASGAFSGIFSAISGFIVGAYMPVSMFPKAIATITTFVPGSSTGGLFRNYLMRGALEEMGKSMPVQVIETLEDTFGFGLQLGDKILGMDFMWTYLAEITVLFLILNIVAGIIRKKKGSKG